MDIHQSPSGKITKVKNGYKSFIPNDLPPIIQWNKELIQNLSKADYLTGKLAKEGSLLPHPHLFIKPFVTREAVLSSKIEGTQTTIGEMLAVAAGIPTNQNPDDIQEVRNYIVALDYGIDRLKQLPLCMRLIKEMHAKLMDGVRGRHATPGEFRYSQNWIGPAGCTITTAKYIPPDPDHLTDCLSSLEKFFYHEDIPNLVHIALCHYQFEAIHPFLDGNGRIGRLLITLLLIQKEILPTPLLYLSGYFETNREEYYRQLFEVSKSGSWEAWLSYFLKGVIEQASDVLLRIERMNLIIANWIQRVHDQKPQIIEKFIHYLLGNPFITISKASRDLNIAFTTAQRAVEKLESLGILVQPIRNKRDRIYCATEILNIIEMENLSNDVVNQTRNF